jgi:predicted adenylyl cyclase CyaB
MLDCLGFSEVAEVDKKRKKFILDKQEISFDNVKGAGWFVEIENTAQNAAERKKALKENIELLKKLGLKEKNIVNEPYRDLVIKKRK